MKCLDALMQELCPDGVEFVKLGEVCKIERGVRVVKKELHEIGKVPVFQNSLTPLGYRDVSNCLGNTSFVISAGAAGEVGFSGVPFWAADDCLVVNCPPVLDNRYSYYFLKNQEDRLKSKVRRASVPRLSRKVVEDLEIPLPPISIQAEIVRILDTFTSLEAELEKELDTELDCRKRQYEYYRDKLLSFDNVGGQEVEWKKMNEVCKSICSGGTPLTSKPEYYDGDIPWLRTQEVDYCEIHSTLRNITKLGLDNSSAKMIPANCVIVAMYGATAAKVAINKIPLCTNQACCNLEIDEDKALVRYVYQWICKQYEVLKAMGEGSQHNINAKKVKDFKIPIPSLKEQNRIVSILDRFESLTTSLQSGLPAEIAARRQQYAHYRDKLLTFRRKGAN